MRVAHKWGEELADGSIHIEQHFSQSDLGELAGIARENVNRHLQHWVQEGLLLFDKGDITPARYREAVGNSRDILV